MTAPSHFDASRALELARSTLDIEARALDALKARQGEGFADACHQVFAVELDEHRARLHFLIDLDGAAS